jgi:hypothetical protein
MYVGTSIFYTAAKKKSSIVSKDSSNPVFSVNIYIWKNAKEFVSLQKHLIDSSFSLKKNKNIDFAFYFLYKFSKRTGFTELILCEPSDGICNGAVYEFCNWLKYSLSIFGSCYFFQVNLYQGYFGRCYSVNS